MTLPTGSERDIDHARQLLDEYCFDLSGFRAGELVAIWQERLDAEPSWIRSAVIEALYQGRYKAFSVEQILQSWKRRGHPIRHFNSEFERIILGPIDPTASKYASMTAASPSELMSAETPSLFTAPRTATSPESPAIAPEPTEPPPSETRDTPSPEAIATPPMEPASPDSPESTYHQLSITDASAFNQPEPIRQFVPETKSSDFYQRLQSVARHSP